MSTFHAVMRDDDGNLIATSRLDSACVTVEITRERTRFTVEHVNSCACGGLDVTVEPDPSPTPPTLIKCTCPPDDGIVEPRCPVHGGNGIDFAAPKGSAYRLCDDGVDTAARDMPTGRAFMAAYHTPSLLNRDGADDGGTRG